MVLRRDGGRREIVRSAILGAIWALGIGSAGLGQPSRAVAEQPGPDAAEARPEAPDSRSSDSAPTWGEVTRQSKQKGAQAVATWNDAVRQTQQAGTPSVLVVTSASAPRSREFAQGLIDSPAVKRLKGQFLIAEMSAEAEPRQVEPLHLTRFPALVLVRRGAGGSLERGATYEGELSSDELIGWLLGIGAISRPVEAPEVAAVSPDSAPEAADPAVSRTGLGVPRPSPGTDALGPGAGAPGRLPAPRRLQPTPSRDPRGRRGASPKGRAAGGAPAERGDGRRARPPAGQCARSRWWKRKRRPRARNLLAPRRRPPRASSGRPPRPRNTRSSRRRSRSRPTRHRPRARTAIVAEEAPTELVRAVAVPEQPSVTLIKPGPLDRLAGAIGNHLARRALPRVEVQVETQRTYRVAQAAPGSGPRMVVTGVPREAAVQAPVAAPSPRYAYPPTVPAPSHSSSKAAPRLQLRSVCIPRPRVRQGTHPGRPASWLIRCVQLFEAFERLGLFVEDLEELFELADPERVATRRGTGSRA